MTGDFKGSLPRCKVSDPDEPTAVLTSDEVDGLFDNMMNKLTSEGHTVIFIKVI